MKANSITSSVIKNSRLYLGGRYNRMIGIVGDSMLNGITPPQNSVSFKGASNLPKHLYFWLRRFSDYMKEPSEMTNAIIAMIGTGFIAPFAIMCSPSKKCKDNQVQDKKAQREKKFFQAIRQPISAFLAFGFQAPTTVAIAKGINHLAYKMHIKAFNDEVLGHLIPGKKYLKGEAKKALRESASPELRQAWAEELGSVSDTTVIKAQLKEKIRKEYSEVGLEVSDTKLEKLASSKKRIRNFIIEKMADAKHKRLVEEKVQELSFKNLDIKDIDLVTESYQSLARHEFENEFKALKANAKLNWFDRFIQTMGFSNKKLNNLSEAEKELSKQKGLELLKKDMPDILTDNMEKLRNFVKNRDIKSQKLFKNKIFWIAVFTNLFMFAASCSALNWFHPRFAEFINKLKEKISGNKPSDTKVEVKNG